MTNSYCIKGYGTEVGYMYVVWNKILHHKLDKSQTENEAGEAMGATPFQCLLKEYFGEEKSNAYHNV